jgi:hypothetical protein
MKKYLFALAFILGFTSPVVFGATPKMTGYMKILSPETNLEITSANIGQQIKVIIVVKDAQLIVNKKATLTYSLSVLPTGSNTPVSFSGKISARFVLPATEGGLTETKAKTDGWAGTQTTTELITIPDGFPAGKATLSLSLTAVGGGAVNVNKTLTIKL